MGNLLMDGPGGFYDQTFGLEYLWQLHSGGGTVSLNPTGGAAGGPAWEITNGAGPDWLSRVFPQAQDPLVTFGEHILTQGLPSSGQTAIMFALADSLGSLISVSYNSLGQILIRASGDPFSFSNAILYTSPTLLITPNVTNKIEVQCNFQTSATGSVQLYLNGGLIGGASGIVTADGGSGRQFPAQIGLYAGNGGCVHLHSNTYVNDGTGSTNNSYEGVCFVATSLTDSEGMTQMWARSSGGTAYTLVNNVPPNLSDYVSTSNLNDLELFGFTPLDAGISSVSIGLVIAFLNKSGAGARQVSIMCSDGTSTTVPIVAQYLGDGYQFVLAQFEVDPIDSSALTRTGITGRQYGVKVTV